MGEMKTTQYSRSTIFRNIDARADRIMAYTIWAYFVFGLLISLFYDTYGIALGVGGTCIVAYFGVKAFLPHSTLYRYVLSSVFAVFAAQYIYQMHGMFEMHFFVFVSSALLICYQNWRLQLPLAILVVIHHGLFAYLQYKGSEQLYFTTSGHMDLITFLFHGTLATVIIGICAYWGFVMEKQTIQEAVKATELEEKLNYQHNILFAEEISKGNLSFDYVLKNEKDELGKALLLMRDNLLKASQREQEERFITVGLNKIGEILRLHSTNINELSDNLIKGIVKYLGANQGGFFLLEDEGEDQHLRLSACFAFERKKYIDKRVDIGQGLVGQCFLERNIIFLKDVPQHYTRITSGLGEATPRCILIVPVQTHEDVVGVLELASFTSFSQHQIDFIQKACENIASAILSARTTDRIKRLLEESQMQTEKMRSQEEEMRQNLEELQATQEEMMRRAQEADARLAGQEA